MSIAYLLSGSNQGNRASNLRNAIAHISELAGEVSRCSPLFESPSWGFDHPTPFLNQAMELQTSLDPHSLLEVLLSIENRCGRLRNAAPAYEARILDLDILFYDDSIIASEKLSIPHPRLHLRRFTLMPLSRIAPDLNHPVLEKSISELLQLCTDESVVREFPGSPACEQKEVSDAV